MVKENSSHRFVKKKLKENFDNSDKEEISVSKKKVSGDLVLEEAVEQASVKKNLKETAKQASVKKTKVKKTKIEKKKVQKEKLENNLENNNKNNKIERELEEIYKNGDGTIPNMSNFKRKKHNRFMRAILFLLFACSFLAAVAWAGFFFFQPQSRFNENDVILSISGEEEVTFGQEVTYRIRYRNAQNIPLSKVNLQVRYPEGFVFENASVTPDTEKNDEWTLGAINQQDSGYIDITGRMYGNVGEQQSFRMFLNYIPSNFNSEFQKVNNINIKIIDTNIEMGIASPEEISVGAEAEFIVEIKKSTEVLQNLVLLLEPISGFNKTSDQPKNDENKNYQWSLDLSKDQIIKIKGIFNPINGEEEAIMNFKLAGWKNEKKEGDPYLLLNKEVKIKLVKTDISANLVINGGTENLTVIPGETLNTTITLKNNGSKSLKNFEVRLIYETPSYNNLSLLNWSSIKDVADGDITGEQVNSQTRRGYIVWNKNKISGLAELKSGEDILIDLSIPLKNSKNKVDLSRFTSYLASAVAEIKYDSEGKQKTLSTNPIIMTVNSDFTFELRDEISENNQNKTLHKITWVLNNTFHEMSNIELSADIYGDVIWQDELVKKSAGEFTYDSTTKKLIWKIDKMPISQDVNYLVFGLLLNTENPTQTNLTSKISIKAHDDITGQNIVLSNDGISL